MNHSSSTVEKPSWQKRLIAEWVAVLSFGLMAMFLAAHSRSGLDASTWVFDRVSVLLAPEPDPQILIVQIDERSLAEFGRWPWPRSLHARLIDRLTDGQVAHVGYDILFVEPSTKEEDDQLSASLARSGRVVLPMYVAAFDRNGMPSGVQLPLPQFRTAARQYGHVNVIFDPDGQVRHADLSIQVGSTTYPHLLKIIAKAHGVPVANGEQNMVIPYNPSGSFSSVSAASVLRGEVPSSLLRGRIILVGSTAQGNGDIISVPGPAGSIMPGVEVQANMLNAMLQDLWLRNATPAIAILIAGILLSCLMSAYWWLPPNRALILTLILAAIAVSVSTLALIWFRTWLTPVPLLAGMMIMYPMWSWRRLSALDRFVRRQSLALSGLPHTGNTTQKLEFGLDTISLASSKLNGLIGDLSERWRFVHNVLESAPDAMCVVDNNGVISLANSRAKMIFGNDAEGRSFDASLESVIQHNPTNTDEFDLISGRTVLVRQVILSSSATISYAVIRLADISERRAIERERNELLEFLSHDIRAPLTSILAIVESGGQKPPEAAPLGRIADHTRASLKLADDFVQLARLAAITPDKSLIDLQAIVEEAVDRIYDLANRRGIRITVDGLDEPPLITGDGALLMRAITNLLDNAIKYSPISAAVRCSIKSTESPHLGSARLLECEIVDQGPGIQLERMEALFQKFGPNDPSHKLSAGLGLAFVKRAVDAMGGSVTARTSPNGTVFTLAFPQVVEPDSVSAI